MQTFDIILQEKSPVMPVLVQDNRDYRPQVDAEGWCEWAEHPHWVLERDIDDGVWCQLRLGGRRQPSYRWPPQAWMLYPPHTGYRIRYEKPEHVHHDLWLMFDVTADLAAQFGSWPLVFGDPEGILLRLVEDLHRHQQAGRPGLGLLTAGALTTLAGRLVAARTGAGSGALGSPQLVMDQSPPQQRSAGALLWRVDEAVCRRLASPPTIGELARSLGFSESSLAHRFRAETGQTLVQRIRWLRIREARALMADNRCRAPKDLAQRLGFSSQQYFGRVFREVTGLTPGQFLAALRRQR